MMDKALEERIISYIKANRWRWSKTYINVPHEYIVRAECTLTKKQFDEFVEAQRSYGVHERWGNYNFPYLYVDGYKYWTMGSPINETIIINRQKVFGEMDSLPDPCVKWYNDRFRDFIFEKVSQFKNTMIFEAYCGLGEYIPYSHISSERYRASEPSNALISAFRAANKGYYKTVTKAPFEGLSDRWKSPGTLVTCLFGKASYILRPYLEMLNACGNNYFMMFFKDGELPPQLHGTHPIGYSEAELRAIFPSAFLIILDNKYIIATNRALNWK